MLVYKDGVPCTIAELESCLHFTYLPQIAFETNEEQEEIRKRGIERLSCGEVCKEAQELGQQWIEQIQSSYIPKVSIKWINGEVGHGLFAEETIKKGSYVGEYTGLVRKNNKRYIEPLNNYCYEYPVPDHLGRSYVIDATQGNLTRFINHSFCPNLIPIHVFYAGFYHLIFIAICRIEKGAQFCYNYGSSYWYVRNAPMELG